METKGKLQGITRDWESGKPIVAFEIQNPNALEGIETLKDKELWIEAKVYRKKRSLSVNAFFHSLCGKIAKALNPPISAERCKNIMIGRYGVQEYEDDEKQIPYILKSNIPPERMLEQDGIHVKVVRGGDNNTWFYCVMKPTHEYDSKEFSVLLDGTIQDANELGIPTITDHEKQKMLESWAKQYEKRTDKRH